MTYIGGLNTNKNKFLYFRTEATDANDDATGDSALFPVSSLMGMQPTGDNSLTLYFKSMLRGSGNEGAADALANLDNNDSVVLSLYAPNTHLEAMTSIVEAINDDNSPSIIVVTNDDSDTGGSLHYDLFGSGISACGTISVAVAYTN